MNTKVETVSIRALPPMTDIAWKILHLYGNASIDDGAKYIEQIIDTNITNQDTWFLAFDFLRLSGNKTLIQKLTEKYARLFNRPPPDWINATPTTADSGVKGVTINIMSMTGPESEQYGTAFETAISKKAAVLIKFNIARQLSWQEIAVTRLAKGIESCQKDNIPIYFENPIVAVQHARAIKVDNRKEADWVILFAACNFMKDEVSFDEHAMEYTMAKGLSPPSYEPPTLPPIEQWFANALNPDEDPNVQVLPIYGALQNATSALQQRVTSKLQRQQFVILDLRGVNQVTWNALVELRLLHAKIASSGQRKIYFGKPSVLMYQLMMIVGIPSNAFAELK